MKKKKKKLDKNLNLKMKNVALATNWNKLKY